MPQKNQQEINDSLNNDSLEKNLIELMQIHVENTIKQNTSSLAFIDQFNKKIQEIAKLLTKENYQDQIHELIAKTIGEIFTVESIKLNRSLNKKYKSSYEIKLNEDIETVTQQMTKIIRSTQKYNKNILLFFHIQPEYAKNKNKITNIHRYIYTQNKNTTDKATIAKEAALIILNLLKCKQIKESQIEKSNPLMDTYLKTEGLSDKIIEKTNKIIKQNKRNKKTQIDIESEIKKQSEPILLKQTKTATDMLNKTSKRRNFFIGIGIGSLALTALSAWVAATLLIASLNPIIIAASAIMLIAAISPSLVAINKIFHINKEEKNLITTIKENQEHLQRIKQELSTTEKAVEQNQSETISEGNKINITNIEQVNKSIDIIKK